jgi:hypothetical protein
MRRFYSENIFNAFAEIKKFFIQLYSHPSLKVFADKYTKSLDRINFKELMSSSSDCEQTEDEEEKWLVRFYVYFENRYHQNQSYVGTNIRHFADLYNYHFTSHAVRIALNGRDMHSDETFQKYHENKTFFITFKLKGGRKFKKIKLSRYTSRIKMRVKSQTSIQQILISIFTKKLLKKWKFN